MIEVPMSHSLSQTLITGVYRSGTEFVSHLINAHPAIDVSMYRINALRFVFNKYDDIALKENYTRALDDIAARVWVRYKLKLPYEKIITALEKERSLSYGVFYDVLMSNLYLNGTKRHWAEKNQLLWREIPIFLDGMPNGKAILILRDPRSVLASFKHFTYAPPPAYLGAIFNCFDCMSYAVKYTERLPQNRFLCVCYENIARNPQKEIQKIWNFMELESGCETEGEMEWKDVHGNKWYANSSFHDKTNSCFFDINAAINRWKKHLTQAETDMTEIICESGMKHFEYQCTQGERNWMEILRLFIHDNKMTTIFSKWLFENRGIEAFPTDPVNPVNWTENADV